MLFNTFDIFPYSAEIWWLSGQDPDSGSTGIYSFKERIDCRIYLAGTGQIRVHTKAWIDTGVQLRNIRDSAGVLLFPNASRADGEPYYLVAMEAVLNPFGRVDAYRYLGNPASGA